MPGGCVLIVEDDQAIRETMSLALEMEGYPTQTASNGEEGLKVLKNGTKPCLILLDLMMPIMDGWAFAHALEQSTALSTIPIVLVTAFGDKGRGIQAKRIIKKPINLDLLSQVVRECCVESEN